VAGGLGYLFSSRWNLNAVWIHRTGWPTTSLSAGSSTRADGSVEVIPVLGLFRNQRLPDYHRIDLRISRDFEVSLGKLGFYLEAQNLFGRRNARGFDDFAFALQADGDVRVDSRAIDWGGILPSFGLELTF